MEAKNFNSGHQLAMQTRARCSNARDQQWLAAHAARAALHATLPAAYLRDSGVQLAGSVIWWLSSVAVMVKSTLEVREQWLPFLEIAVGEGRKKNMDLGFHGFYHGGPYGSIIFHLGRKILIFAFKSKNSFGFNES